MNYRIKQTPEDFQVKELMDLPLGEGPYSYYLLTKRTWTTQAAIDRVARAFRKRGKYVNFAGNKDKQALTEQFISILHGPGRDLSLNEGEIQVKYLGRGRERLNLGSSPGNQFSITVRNLPKGFEPREVKQVVNYFDEQRFGMNLNNHLVGKHLVKKEFQKACELVPETQKWLSNSSRDYVGALRSLPKRVLRIYAHSYQSWLWNSISLSYLEQFPHTKVSWPLGELLFPKEEVKNIKVPIPGYSTRIPRGLGGLVKNVMEKEGIKKKDFLVKQFREFDLGGDLRDLVVNPESLLIPPAERDELNPGKLKYRVEFSLPKGCYATMVIRAIFS